MSDAKVLVVDDSTTMRKIISDSLSKIGFSNVIQAGDGQIALTKLSDVELILTDWNMPNMNGLELTEAVRKDAQLKDIPILMITTRNMKEDIVTAIKCGVNGYIVKPFDAKTLNDKINEIMN